MDLTTPCSQLHYFPLMSLKGIFITFYYFVVLDIINSLPLVEGDRIMHIVFLHFLDFTCINGERNTEI